MNSLVSAGLFIFFNNKNVSNMKTKKSDLKIGSLKLVNGGMKGMVVSYLDPVMKNGNLFMDKCVVEKSAPVTFELIDKISQLGNYLLDICGYTTNELERDIVTGKQITKIGRAHV